MIVVDTTCLSDDIYPKCSNILAGIKGYEQFTNPLCGKRLLKSKKVFDSSKVTDHHAIIPTGVATQNLTEVERNVYDLIVRSFISVFYPDCKFFTTTVLGRVEDVDFKVSGKQITEPGWKTIYDSDAVRAVSTSGSDDNVESVLPIFEVGECGPHEPTLMEKWTQPPKAYTEATLLRAM